MNPFEPATVGELRCWLVLGNKVQACQPFRLFDQFLKAVAVCDGFFIATCLKKNVLLQPH